MENLSRVNWLEVQRRLVEDLQELLDLGHPMTWEVRRLQVSLQSHGRVSVRTLRHMRGL